MFLEGTSDNEFTVKNLFVLSNIVSNRIRNNQTNVEKILKKISGGRRVDIKEIRNYDPGTGATSEGTGGR